MVDLVIRNSTVVSSHGTAVSDIAIDGGHIVEVAPDLDGRTTINAKGLVAFPGVIDVHVHFNEPGRTEWEGGAHGSRALAAGGGTLFFDMPLNSAPCTIAAADFDRKRAALEASSITDFGLWGGIVPGRVRDMEGTAARGAVGFKAFMSNSGLREFPRADDATLLEGMREAARLKLPVAVHAESEELTRELGQRMRSRSPHDFLRSRPVIAELDAIQRALLFAAETGAALHIVHISSGRGVVMAFEAKTRGVDVSIETCPHYLLLTDADIERLGTLAKCMPPLRSAADRDQLWTELAQGHVDVVASDHSPTEPALKQADFWSAWGGIAGVQTTLAGLLEGGHHERGLALTRIAALLADNPARRFRIPRKGAIAPGYDADITLVDLDASSTLTADQLLQRHKVSPYVGRTFRGAVRRTIRRGESIFADGRIVAGSRGALVRPATQE